jgi:hypothetical protein
VNEAWLQQIRSHVERHIGRIDRVFSGDPARETADVLYVRPINSRPYHTLVTAGMSSVAMQAPADASAPRRIELMMTLPEAWKMSSDTQDDGAHWPTRLLQSLSRWPREHEGWLGWGGTVPNGDPPQQLAPRTALCGVFVAPSLLVPVSFYELDIVGERVAFYSAIPLYREELELQAREGMAALLERLLHNDINDVVDIKRRNVGKKKLFGLF